MVNTIELPSSVYYKIDFSFNFYFWAAIRLCRSERFTRTRRSSWRWRH